MSGLARLVSGPSGRAFLEPGFGYYPWVRLLFVIPYLTAAATVYVGELYLAFQSWRERWRSPWREKWWQWLDRVHYSIVAVSLAWYPLLLVASGLIP